MSQTLIKILLIEDELPQVRLLQEFLKDSDAQSFSLVYSLRLEDGIHQTETELFDIILLDLTLPDSHGLASFTTLSQQAPTVPIVVLTNTNDNNLAVETVRLGAQDYLVKNQITPELLTRSLRYAIERKQTAEMLRQHNDLLELRVQERTAELMQTNQDLRQEIHCRQQMQEALAQEKELAQVTLHSIGDAVITTNSRGEIESLNPVAEDLTGWRTQDAHALPLNEVLQLFSEETGYPVPNPVSRVLATGLQTARVQRTLLKNKLGREFVIEHSAAPILLKDGSVSGVVLVCRDMTYTRELISQLSWQACHDSLTGLINRREFERHIKEAVERVKLVEECYALCFIDLDQFKVINDTCGHTAGDELLRQISALLQQRIRKTDILARLGGDEFGLLLPACSEEEGLKMLEQLQDLIHAFRFTWDEKLFSIGASMGLVVIDCGTESCAEALSAVDTAMYRAKEQGGRRVQVLHPQNGELATLQGYHWIPRLVKALETHSFCLYAQKVTPLQPHASAPVHYELLLRLRGEQGQIIVPSAFIPAAERYNLMPELDQWVIRELFSQLQTGALPEPATIYSINLSGATLNSDHFLSFVHEQLSLCRLQTSKICFEMTETYAVTNLQKAVELIRQLKQWGCLFALDDFGSGMSSLAYLKELPVDYLKIGGSFIRNVAEDPISAAMVAAIHNIAHVMKLQTIAEYVVNDAILDKLKTLGIDYGQGFAIANPVPLSSLLHQDIPQPALADSLIPINEPTP